MKSFHIFSVLVFGSLKISLVLEDANCRCGRVKVALLLVQKSNQVSRN